METFALGTFETIEQSLCDKDVQNGTNFIEANTKEVQLSPIQNRCIISVFAKDNESTNSHQDFISVMREASQSFF
jgi:hypothetical protein